MAPVTSVRTGDAFNNAPERSTSAGLNQNTPAAAIMIARPSAQPPNAGAAVSGSSSTGAVTPATSPMISASSAISGGCSLCQTR